MNLYKRDSRFFYLKGLTIVVAGLLGWLASALVAPAALAGIFGPDNYEDCVLEKMKGQERHMMRLAREACEKQFPSEKELEYGKHYDDSTLNIEWCDSDFSTLSVCVPKNDTEYRVTRVIMVFSRKDCKDAKYDDYQQRVTFTFSRLWEKSSAEVKDASAYKCMRKDSVYGLNRK